MNGLIRYCVGWVVAMCFVITGMLLRKVKFYTKEGSLLALVGHNPTKEVFEDIVNRLLKFGFIFISGDEAIAIKDGLKAWRPKLAWLSFDDGWKGFTTNVLPVLEKHNIPATLFVAPHETEQGYVWINGLLASKPKDDFSYLFWKSVDDRENIVKKLVKQNTSRQLLHKEEIIELSKHPLITIENHTLTHLSCSHRPIDEVIDEIRQTQTQLEEWTGREPKMVCYPFGHYNEKVNKSIVNIGLLPVTSDSGDGMASRLGMTRGLFRDNGSGIENLCRVLNAWKTVCIKDKN